MGVLGGRGGGAAIAGETPFAPCVSLDIRGGGGKGVLCGGGGGTEDIWEPWKAGGTPNLGFWSGSASIGVFGGLGGGGGPAGAAFEAARCVDAGTVALEFANLPASAIGGGALNLGRGGEGVRSGDLEGGLGGFAGDRVMWLSTRLRRAGGNAGGGPLLDETVLPVF